MLRVCIIGASGYTGAELISLISQHPQFSLTTCYVSTNSEDANKRIDQLHPKLQGKCELSTLALDETQLASIAEQHDLIFLATPHEASHAWAAELCTGKAKVFDLSGAFRLQDQALFSEYYGFAHTSTKVLKQAVYGLAEWNAEAIKHARFVAVPGCYPTASLLALKPIASAGLIAQGHAPIINAVSGISGAGRKPSMTSSFYELSLQAYGVLGHRHTPEIETHLQHNVVFTPHLGNFKRGILATITVKLESHVNQAIVNDTYQQAYAEQPLVRLTQNWPKIDDVAHLPYCDLHWKYDQKSGYLVVSSAIDNLLKGAASQAIQCANLASGLASEAGLQ